MWIVQGRVIWHSTQFDFSTFALASDYIEMENFVIMARATVDGLYVSTTKGIFFIDGLDPAEMTQRMIADYPALEWSDIKFHGTISALQNGSISVRTAGDNLCAMWLTSRGICVGGPEGQFYNITDEKIDLPAALSGAGLIWDGKFIGNINP